MKTKTFWLVGVLLALQFHGPQLPAAQQGDTEAGLRLGNMDQLTVPDPQRAMAALNLFGSIGHVAVQEFGYAAAVERLAYTFDVDEVQAATLIDLLMKRLQEFVPAADAVRLEHCQAYEKSLPALGFMDALAMYRANEQAITDFSARYFTDLLNGLDRVIDREFVRRIEQAVDQRAATGDYRSLIHEPDDLEDLERRVATLCDVIRARNGVRE